MVVLYEYERKHNELRREDLLKGDLKSEGVNMAPWGNNAAVCTAFGIYINNLSSHKRFQGS